MTWSVRLRLSKGMRVFIGVTGVVLVVPSMTWILAESRGPGVGLAAGLFFGLLTTSFALWPEQLQTWSARHPVLDSLIFLPLSLVVFLAWLSEMPWQQAALVAVAVSAIVIPLMWLVRPRLRRWLYGNAWSSTVQSHSESGRRESGPHR